MTEEEQSSGPGPEGGSDRYRPEVLGPEDVERELATMPGWSGDTTRISRRVAVGPARVQPLLQAVHRIESELDHHARIDQGPDALDFTIWTHTLNRVTDLDLELARRIDDAIRRDAQG